MPGLIRWSPPPCERYADRVFFFLKGIIMQNVTLIGIDLGKHSFHVHAQDKNGNALLRKKFSRNQLTAFLSTCAALPLLWSPAPVPTLWPATSASSAIR